MTESTWKILKADWKIPGFFCSKRVAALFVELIDAFVIVILMAQFWRFSLYW